MEEYKHTIKVTSINGKYHCRLFRNDKLVSEIQVTLKEDIGWACREMLRWQDKLGYISQFDSAARVRQMKTPYPKGKYEWVMN